MVHKFKFTFKFDDDKVGTITYTGDIIKCISQYDADVKSGALPSVNCLVSIKNLAAKI